MKLRIAGILLLAGLGVPAAQAAEHEVGGELSLGYGFKPEFVEADGDGKYYLVGGKVSLKTESGLSLSLEEAVKAVEHPEGRIAAEDPIFRLGYPSELGGLAVAYGLLISPGVSLASREADYYAAVRPGVSASKALGDFRLGVGASVTRHFRKYTLAADGTSTTAHTRTATLALQYARGKFGAALGVAFREAVPYEGKHKFSYVNEFSLTHQTTAQLSFEATFSTTDAQQAADGSEINEFSVYRQNKSELYLGATYAL